jgi:GPH family glycoside/pentoside/hexuronide:cation symporter
MNENRLPLAQKIAFSIGQFGWSLISFGVSNLLVYFYFPPDDGKVTFPNFIEAISVFGAFQLVGVISFGGRFLDAFFDPFVGGLSDRMGMGRLGKRKRLMAYSAIPVCIMAVLVFVPLYSYTSSANAWWLAGCLVLYYCFFSLYVIPYTALMGDLGYHPDDALQLSTLTSATWAVGLMVGNTCYMLHDWLQHRGYGVEEAFQYVMMLYSVLACVAMLVPVLWVNEKRYARTQVHELGQADSMREVFKDKNFVYFIFSDLFYWLSVTFVQMGVVYYITLLFDLPSEEATRFLAFGFVMSLVSYPLVGVVARKYGVRRTILSSFGIYVVLFGLLAGLGWLPISDGLAYYGSMLLAAVPMAVFGILPNVVVTRIMYAHRARTGLQLTAMFFAVRAFMMKLGVSLANLLFPTLLAFGKSQQNDMGVRLTAVCALFFCVVGAVCFYQYNEDELADERAPLREG